MNMALPFDTSVVCPVFIGREAPLASFERVFAQVKSGQEHTVLVSGEAGIGKSRLVAEVTKRIGPEQAEVLRGACFEQDRSLPFAPLVDLLRTLLLSSARDVTLRSLAPVAPELMKLLPDLALFLPQVTPTPSLGSAQEEQRRLFVALTHFFVALTDQRPLVLVIEDLHWSDDTSLDFLRFLIRYGAARPLLLVLTYRREEVHPVLAHFLSSLDRERVALECSLGALTQEEVHEMLRTLFQLKKPVRRDFLEALYQLTDGNPFFVEEVLKALLASGDIFFSEGRWDRKELGELHIPRSVSDAVQQRTRLLGEAERETLAVAAVVGRQVEVALVQAVTGRPHAELLVVLDTLIAAQLLVETSSGQYAFRHTLTQAAVYQGLPVSRRKALHLTIGQMLEDRPAAWREAHLADLAAHFLQAEAWTQALAYEQRLGAQALALYAPREAVEHVSRALTAAAHLPEANLIPLYRVRGAAYDLLGAFDAAQRDYEQAIQLARATGEPQEEWQSLKGLWMLWSNHGHLSRLGDLCQRLLELAQQLHDPLKVAHSQNLLGHWLVYSHHPQAGLALHEQALAVLQHHAERQPVLSTLQYLGQAAEQSGDLRRAVSYYDQAIALARTSGDLRTLAVSLALRSVVASPSFAEAVESAGGTLAACQRNLEETRRLVDKIEWRTGQAFAHCQTSLMLLSFGRLGEGLTHARAALAIATEIENQQWLAGSYASLGEAHLLLLDPTEAIALLETGLAVARQVGLVQWIGYITVAMVRALLLTGDLPRAAMTLEQFLPPDQAPRSIQERRAAWVRGELLLALRTPELALRLADELLASAPGSAQRAERQPLPALLKLRGEALCALDQVEEAICTLEEACQGAHEQGALPLLWQIHRSRARVYVRTKRKQLAHQALAAARQIIADLATSLDDTVQRERFRSTALSSLPPEPPLTPRQSAKQASGGLSEQERAIALLMAQGHSNRAIADALVISQRTVETHMSHIYAKLGISSRTQLAAWVVEKGLLTSSLP